LKIIHRVRPFRLAWPFLATLVSSPLAAQTELPPVVVTADKKEVPEENVSSSVTVITREEMERQAATTVGEVLRNVAGVDIQSDGPGEGDANIRIRGSDTDQVLVMIDGIPLNATNDDRPLILTSMTLDNVERIEVVRGSQSVLYGNEAVGGVINIITRKGTKEAEYSATLEAGTLQLFREALGASGSPGKASYSAAFSRTDQRGRFDRDRFGQFVASSNFAYQILPELKANVGLHYFDADQEFPTELISSFDPATFTITLQNNPDVNLSFHLNTLATQGGIQAVPLPWWEIRFFHSFLMDWQRLKNPAAGEVLPPGFNSGSQDYTGQGYVNTSDLRNFFTIYESPAFSTNFTLGVEFQDERFGFTDPPLVFPDTSQGQEGDRQNYATYFKQDFLLFDESLILSGGARFDHNTTFGNEWSPKGSILYKLKKTGTTFRGSYGEGFHGPTILTFFSQVLAQRTGGTFDPVLLQSEKTQSYEVGVDQKIGRWADVGTTFFYVDYDSLLDGLQFIQDAYTTGIEAEVSVRPLEQLTFGGNYTWLRSRNEVLSQPLVNRPAHRAHFFVQGEPIPALSLRADLNVVSQRQLATAVSTAIGDITLRRIDAAGNVSDGTLDAYVKVDLAAVYKILENRWRLRDWRVYLKIENLLDDQYEERFGSVLPGITFLAGTRASF
jgi:vitamin B12 transporter